MKILTRKATTKGGRNGTINAEDGALSLEMGKPKEMGGTATDKTNPEEIFAAGYSACFASSLEFLLENDKVDYDTIEVTVACNLVKDPDGGFKFDIDLDVTLEGLDEKAKEHYIQGAYNFCPYSKAMKGNVDIRINQ